MAVVHKNLPDSELHEPKGFATVGADQVYVSDGGGSGTFRPYDPGFSPFEGASADQVYVSDGANGGVLLPYKQEPKGIDTAVADQVYVADGSGSGSWQDYYTPSAPAYASMLAQNDTVLSLSAASDSTLKTDSDFVPLNGTSMWVTEAASNVTAATSSGQFTIASAGDYQIHLAATIKASVANKIAIIYGDGSTFYTKRPIEDVGTDGTTLVADTVLPSLSVNDVIGAYIASDSAIDVTVVSITFTVTRLS